MTERQMTGRQGQGRADRGGRAPAPRGVPDGLFIAAVVVLLLIPAVTWLAVNVGGWYDHGGWPGLHFTQAATAVRGIITRPNQFQDAWPASVRHKLPSTDEFWTFFIVLFVALVGFAGCLLYTVHRRRARRRAEAAALSSYIAERNAGQNG